MKGYYSLIQYCPDTARREAANVGVMLLCPEAGFLDVKMTTTNHRVRRFFGKEADHYLRLDQMKAALRERLKIERERLLSVESLTGFISTWANKVSVTVLRPVKVLSPVDDLRALYKELVDDPVRDLSIRAALSLRDRLDSVLGVPKFAPVVQQHVQVEVPAFKRPIVAPYGYRNGRFNLVVPGEFTQRHDANVENAACKLAVEGHSLFKHKDAKLGELQLVVVADFTPGRDEARRTVKNIFTENNVRLFDAEKLSELEDEIVAHAKPLNLN